MLRTKRRIFPFILQNFIIDSFYPCLPGTILASLLIYIVEIASVPGWTNPREWDKYPQQQSGPLYLEEGNSIFFQTGFDFTFPGSIICCSRYQETCRCGAGQPLL